MRVLFPAGMQRAFLDYAKRKSGLTWKEFYDLVHNRSHVNYRYEVCSLPYQTFTRAIRVAGIPQNYAHRFRYKLVKSVKIIREVQKINRNASLAELVGICLGDGHLRPRFLAIFGGKCDDTTYLVNHVAPLIRKVTGLDARLNTHRPDENFLALYSTAASRSLHRVGLPYGDKIVNHAQIPRWIFERDSLLTACLRGLFDTDGSVYGFRRKPPAKGSKAIVSLEFGPGSLLATDAYRAFRRLGYSPRMMPHRNECRLAVNRDIVRFMKEVRPANGKHRSQFLRWHGPVV